MKTNCLCGTHLVIENYYTWCFDKNCEIIYIENRGIINARSQEILFPIKDKLSYNEIQNLFSKINKLKVFS